jgi:hypothetical protein
MFHVVDLTVVNWHDDTVVSLEVSELLVLSVVSGDHVKVMLGDGESVLEDSPSDTFPAGRSGNGAYIHEQFIGVQGTHEFFEGDLVSSAIVRDVAFSRAFFTLSDFIQFHGLEDIFSDLEILFTVFDGLGSFVFTVSLGEHQTKDSVVSFVFFISR